MRYPFRKNVNGEISISPDLCIENCTYYLADETAELKADIKDRRRNDYSTDRDYDIRA